jgi:hypothetical protein
MGIQAVSVQYNATPSAPLYYGASISLEAASKGKVLAVQWNTGKVGSRQGGDA